MPSSTVAHNRINPIAGAFAYCTFHLPGHDLAIYRTEIPAQLCPRLYITCHTGLLPADIRRAPIFKKLGRCVP